MAELKSTVITGDLSVSGQANIDSGAVVQGGDLTLYQPGTGNSPALIFQRGTLSDNYNDWQIQDRGGYLQFDQRGNSSTAFSNVAILQSTGLTVPQVTVSADPTANMQVATKQYVDNSTTPATFKITISLNMSTGVYTADKTWAEIASAVSGGMLVYAVYSSAQYALSYFLNSGMYTATFSKSDVTVAVPPLINQDQVSGDKFVVSHSSSTNTDTWTRSQVTLKDSYPYTATVSVPYQLWGSNTDLPITVTGMTSSATVWVSPNPSSSTNIDNYNNAKLYCSAQATDSLTFTYAGTKPTADISVNVVWIK